ncbi:helix-turn-helix transcriptional regulator [Sandaracinus amylolyticus]|nr:AraC family transcriptional regulator [Sandaracinus amylolyticus]
MPARALMQCAMLSVIDYRCTVGLGSVPFPEQHRAHTLAYVRKGTFGYRTRGVRHELVPGSVLVGRPGDEYVCSHEHACGDECLSFQLSPALVGAFGDAFTRVAALPPLPEIVVLGELAQAAASGASDVGLDEIGLALAHRFVALALGRTPTPTKAGARDRRRAIDAALFLDACSREEIDLERTAREVDLSPFHFLRVFSSVVGVTPHQYLVRARIRRAAHALSEGDRAIAEIAFDVGFGDLSNFVRTFRRAAGLTPRAYRDVARGRRKICQEARNAI